MTPQRFARLRAALARRQPDLTVLMDNVRKAHNFSALMRTCDAVGVHEVHGVWPAGDSPPQGATSSGAEKWMHVALHPDIGQAIAHLHARDFQVVTTSLSAAAVDYREIDYTRPTAIVFGAELHGVSDAALRGADRHARIPMRGMAQSLNLSVAAAVILYEAERQRARSGFYERSRLDERSWRRTLFEWAHPRVAAHCRRLDIDYPPLDDDGLIVAAPAHSGADSGATPGADSGAEP